MGGRRGDTEVAESGSGSARSADRALDVLELLSGRGDGLTLSEMTQELSIPSSSLHGLLRVLVGRRYLVPADVRRRYRLGSKVLELGAGYLRGTGLYAEARSIMHNLAERTEETVHMAILEGRHILYLDTIDGKHPMRMISPLGERLPAHATAAGKALLSLLPNDQIAALYANASPERYTWRTVVTLDDLFREIDEVRILGIARDTEEYMEGLCCVAAPVAGQAGRAAAISVSVPRARMTAQHAVTLARCLHTYSSLPGSAHSLERGRMDQTHYPQTHHLRIAWSMGTMAVQAYEEMHRAARRCASERGVELYWTNARDDIVKQAADIDCLLALHPDVIVIHAADTTRAEELFGQTRAAHIPVLCFQRPARTSAFDAFIGADTYTVGRMQVDFVAAHLGGRGNLVVIEGDPYNDNARNIARGVLDAVAQYPNLHILGDEPSPHWSPETAQSIAEEALTRYGTEIHAFVVANDAMAGGVAAALNRHNLAGTTLLVGADGDAASLQRIRQGLQHGTAFQNPLDLADIALSFAIGAASGTITMGTLPRRSIFHSPSGPDVRVRDVPYLFVSRDNLAILEEYWSSLDRHSGRGHAAANGA